jgi:hypothetical protein
MLNLYRRHGLNCPHKDRKFRRCSCPLWCDGTLSKKRIHRTLHTRNWEQAQKKINELELAGKLPDNEVTITDASESFLNDARTES